MELNPMGDAHYRVKRFYPHPGHGVMEETIGEHLTLEAARALAEENPPLASTEEVVVQDELLKGLEAEIETWRA